MPTDLSPVREDHPTSPITANPQVQSYVVYRGGLRAEPSPLRDGTCHVSIWQEEFGRRHLVGSRQAEHPSAPEAIEDQRTSGGSLWALSLFVDNKRRRNKLTF